MSTQPIIVQIVDQVDPNIVAKISGIAAASRAAALEVTNLQLALNNVSASSGLTNLSASLGKIQTTVQSATPDVGNLSKALATIGVSSDAAAVSSGTLADVVKTIQPAAAASNQALTDMAFALRNLSNGTYVVPELASAIQRIPTAIAPSNTALQRMAEVLSGVTNSATLAERTGTDLADAFRLLPTPVKATDEALGNMAFALKNVSNGSYAVKPLADAINLLPPVVRQSDAALLGMAAALNGTTNAANLAQRTGTTLADAWRLLPPVAQKSNAELLNMAFALRTVSIGAIPDVVAKSNVLLSSVANLVSRAVGAEAGFGRMGGAIARVGTLAIGAAPLLIALFAVGAIVTAVVWYEKAEKAARDLADAMIALADSTARSNDRLLDQNERLIGLVSGPMAKYKQELADLSQKSIEVSLQGINKVLDDQKSRWADLVAFTQRYITVRNLAFALTNQPASITPNQQSFDIQDAQDFIRQQELERTLIKSQNDDVNKFIAQLKTSTLSIKDQQTAIKQYIESAAHTGPNTKNQLEALQSDLQTTLTKIADLRRQEDSQTGRNKGATDVAIAGLTEYYNELLLKEKEYYSNEKTIRNGANGEFLTEQRKAAADQLKLFEEELSNIKRAGGLVTVQQELILRQQQEAGTPRPTELPGAGSQAALPLNVKPLDKDIGTLTQDIAKQNLAINTLLEKYQLAAQKAGAYSDAMKAQAEAEKLILDLTGKRTPITDELSKRIEAVTNAAQVETRIGKEEVAIYNEFRGPLQTYSAALAAVNRLLSAHAITAEQAAAVDKRALITYNAATDPLANYIRQLTQSTAALEKFGTASPAVIAQIQALNKALEEQGKPTLNVSQTAQLTQTLEKMEQQKQVIADLNVLWEVNTGAEQKNVAQQLALNKAYAANVITLGQWRAATLNVALAQNQLNNALKGGTFTTNLTQVIGGLIPLFTSLQNVGHQVIQNLDKDFTQFFNTLTKGIANGIAQWAVYGGSLSTALLNTARQAVAGLISSLIELGLQYVIVIALQKAFGITLPNQNSQNKNQLEGIAIALGGIAAITAAQLTSLTLLQGPAWALAEAVSLASFGANAAPAEAGIAGVVAAGAAASAAGKFAQGGLIVGIGTPTSDNIPILVSPGEFVVNAQATSQHQDLLEALNKNASTPLSSVITGKYAGGGLVAPMMPKFAQGGLIEALAVQRFAGGGYVTNVFHQVPDLTGSDAVNANATHVSTSVQMKVNVVHDGSTNLNVEQVDETTVRIIAKREAKAAVQDYAPDVISNDLHNPNSRVSKAVSRNVVAPRKR